MKWVKLIGGRFLDFIITSAVVVLLCIGVVLIGEHYERMAELERKYMSPEIMALTPEEIESIEQQYLSQEEIESIEQQYAPVESRQPEVGRAHGMTAEEAEAFIRKHAPVEPTDQQVEPKEPDKTPAKRDLSKFIIPEPLFTPHAIRKVTLVLSIAIGMFGVLSVLGIVFRREGLTQREGFVRVWVGVPKYFAGYLRKSNTKGE